MSQIAASPSIKSLATNPPKQGERYVVQEWHLHAAEIDVQHGLVTW